MKSRRDQLRSQVEQSLVQADAGETQQLDIEAIIARGYDRLAREGIADSMPRVEHARCGRQPR